MKELKAIKNSGHPDSKATNRTEKQKKFGHIKIVCNHKANQIYIRDGVAKKRQYQIYNLCPDVYALRLLLKCSIGSHCLVVQFLKPCAQSKNANILCCCQISRISCKIVHLLFVLCFFLAVTIAPCIQRIAHSITDSCRYQNNQHQKWLNR